MTDMIKKAMEVGFDKRRKPSMLLANLFKVKKLKTNKVEIQGRVVDSIYSVDVKLGTGGRRQTLSEHETQEFTIPEYNDLVVISEDDMFKAQFGETVYEQKAANVANMINDRQIVLSDMQRRAEEKQASDALFFGSITLAGGGKINFKKKATHDIQVATKWNAAGATPLKDIEAACKVCVDDALLAATEFNLWLEDSGLTALLANEEFRANADINKGIKRTDINIPLEATPGGLFHGRVTVGSNIVNIWTYNEKYTIPKGYNFENEGAKVGYIPTGRALIVPVETNFKRYYAAINNVNAPSGALGGAKLELVETEQMAYAYDELNDGSAVTKAGVKSRPLCVPVDIDSFATLKGLV